MVWWRYFYCIFKSYDACIDRLLWVSLSGILPNIFYLDTNKKCQPVQVFNSGKILKSTNSRPIFYGVRSIQQTLWIQQWRFHLMVSTYQDPFLIPINLVGFTNSALTDQSKFKTMIDFFFARSFLYHTTGSSPEQRNKWFPKYSAIIMTVKGLIS